MSTLNNDDSNDNDDDDDHDNNNNNNNNNKNNNELFPRLFATPQRKCYKRLLRDHLYQQYFLD